MTPRPSVSAPGPSGAGAESIRDFASFWPHYVGEHRRRGCRALHYVGTGGAVALAVVGALAGWPWLVPGGLVFGYGCAWVGHFLVERNRPATLRHPLYSFRADFKMLWLALTGRMHRQPGLAPPVADRQSPGGGDDQAVAKGR